MATLTEKQAKRAKRNSEIITRYRDNEESIESLAKAFDLTDVYIMGILNKGGVLKRKNAV